MSKFQLILTAFFIICIVAGVAVFATYKGKNNPNALPTVTLWGTFPASLLNQYLEKVNLTRAEAIKINYTEIQESNFNKTFIEALARGTGPDAILIPQDLINKHEDKIIPIPYVVLTRRDFKNTFIEQSELYLYPQGVMALPFSIDPLVMYWNRDIFRNAGVAVFPKYWDEFTKISQKITQKDVNSNIRRATIAMGEFTNIFHAREILGALFLQAGNPVVYRDDSNQESPLSSAIGNGTYNGISSSLLALNFFTKFSDPRDSDYSWNRSLSNSKNFFLSGNLATYIGFASETRDIRQKNPNLDFDIAPLPQIRGSVDNIANKATFGSMYGLSVVKSAFNTNAVYSVLSSLVSAESLAQMIPISYLPPVRRDMIAGGNTDPYLSIFYDSALISKGWLDTNKSDSYGIFKEIVESVTSGKKSSSQALQDGSDEFNISLQNK